MPKRIIITLNDEYARKLEAIRARYDLSTGGALKLAVYFAFEDQFPKMQANPSGKIISVGRPALSDDEIRKPRTPEEKKRIREEARREELVRMATAPYPDGLAGTVSDDGKKVAYFTYFERGKDERTLLLREINRDLIEVQYQPSYGEIMRMQAEGKVDYEVSQIQSMQ